MQHMPSILVVDDEPINIEILLEYLEDLPYGLETAADGCEAWAKLAAEPERYDVVILDRMMPNMSGLEVLQRIKAHPVLQSVPVILQTGMAAKEDVLEGLKAGAYYYLTKPFQEEMLRSVVDTAMNDRLRYRRMLDASDAAGRSLVLLQAGDFLLRTPTEARDLATVLANAFPNPRRVVIGLAELLLNAVEHGNLAVSYAEKGQLQKANAWEQELARRLEDPRYRARAVAVAFRREVARIVVTITDQGDGFDWRGYLDIDPDRVLDTHGRGIAMSRLLSFDALSYLGRGNCVEAVVAL